MNRRKARPYDLGELDPAWRGFVIRNGCIFTPGGTPYVPGEIESIPLRRQQLAELERQLATPEQLLL